MNYKVDRLSHSIKMAQQVNMYCGYGCGSQLVDGNFMVGALANTTVAACPNNNGNGHLMIPVGTSPPGMFYFC